MSFHILGYPQLIEILLLKILLHHIENDFWSLLYSFFSKLLGQYFDRNNTQQIHENRKQKQD